MRNIDAKDESSYFITIRFFDEAGDPVAPTAALWTLTDDNGRLINNRNQVPIVSPTDTEIVILQGDDLADSDGKYRILTIEAVYDSTIANDLPLNDEFKFDIRDLIAIPNSGVIVP